jgi:hypothetical protein
VILKSHIIIGGKKKKKKEEEKRGASSISHTSMKMKVISYRVR